MIEHYIKLYDNTFYNDKGSKYKEYTKYSGSNRVGDKYINNLFQAAIFAFVDKFGIYELDDKLFINKIYVYSYSIRLENKSVSKATINKNKSDYFEYLYNFAYTPDYLKKTKSFNIEKILKKFDCKDVEKKIREENKNIIIKEEE